LADVNAAGLSTQSGEEFVESSMFDWALDQFLNGGTDEGPKSGVIDFSGLSHEEKMVRAFLDAVFWDGGMQHFERIESKPARDAIAWAATQNWPRVLSVFKRLLDIMADVMDLAAAGNDPRQVKAAGWFANELAGFVRTLAKYESGDWKPSRLDKTTAAYMSTPEAVGEPERVTDRLWLNSFFQQARRGMKGGRRISSPQARFAEFVAQIIIGHKDANTRINGRDLVLFGVKWKKPKSCQEFDGVRDVLVQASFEQLDALASYLEEDRQEGAASIVRGLKTLEQYRCYWRERQLDEAFRAYFGLTKPRKYSPAKKAAKARKTKGKHSG
jgi:hypothetical protein